MRERFPVMRTEDLARDLGRSYSSIAQRAMNLDLKKSPEWLLTVESGRLLKGDTRGGATRFKPGQASWNKGKEMPSRGRSIDTQFRPGMRPQTWVPIGTETLDKDGYLKRKVRDDAPPGMSRKNWVFVQRLVWEQHHGPIPPGHHVAFKNGDKTDIRIENLELLTQRAMMLRNTVQNLPKELATLVQLRGAVNRQINRRLKANGQ